MCYGRKYKERKSQGLNFRKIVYLGTGRKKSHERLIREAVTVKFICTEAKDTGMTRERGRGAKRH